MMKVLEELTVMVERVERIERRREKKLKRRTLHHCAQVIFLMTMVIII